jgi:hypothetical protein
MLRMDDDYALVKRKYLLRLQKAEEQLRGTQERLDHSKAILVADTFGHILGGIFGTQPSPATQSRRIGNRFEALYA